MFANNPDRNITKHFSHKSYTFILNPTNIYSTFQAMAPLPQIIMYNAQAIDYERVYCASTISTVQNKATLMNWLLLSGDYLMCLGDFLLYCYNKKQIEKYKQ